MFSKQFSNVTIQTFDSSKRGSCLSAVTADRNMILMDYCGMNPALVPDGAYGYFFANDLIILCRQRDMDYGERQRAQQGDLVLEIAPGDLMRCKVHIGTKTEDLQVDLYNCSDAFNDEHAPFGEIIFVFSDTGDNSFLTARGIALPSELQQMFTLHNQRCHALLAMDDRLPSIIEQAKASRDRDGFDFLYDAVWDASKKFLGGSGEAEEKNIAICINGKNEVTYVGYHPEQLSVSEEVKNLLERAKNGDAEAMYLIGGRMQYGQGMPKDISAAVSWYRGAMEKGSLEGKMHMAICMSNGAGIEKDPEKAMQLLSEAAQAGLAEAQFWLGMFLLKGHCCNPDPQQAQGWLQQAAANGYEAAREYIGKV